jgi:spore coat protein U-like protein
MKSRNSLGYWLAAAVFALFAAVLAPSPASAQEEGAKCSFTMSNISFNTVDPASPQPAMATGTFTYACTGDAREIIRICPSFGVNATPRFMTDAAGNKLLFDLYSDQGMATIWGTWFGKVKGPTIDVPMGRSERASGSALVYGRIAPGQQNVPPGEYQLSEGGNNTSIDYGYASKGSCQAILRSNFIRTPFTVSAMVRSGGGTASQSAPPPQTAPVNNQADHKSGGGFLSKLVANAQYQQAKQNGASADELEEIKQGAGVNNGVRDNTNSSRSSGSASYGGGDLPPCRSEDPNAHLENGKWVGPHCLTEPDDGHYVTDEEAKKQNADLRAQRNSQERQEARADFLETHSCMTTLGADKANELASDCEKVTDAPHQACNIQENSCDAIRKATQKGCWGRGAEGPDWCHTKYP